MPLNPRHLNSNHQLVTTLADNNSSLIVRRISFVFLIWLGSATKWDTIMQLDFERGIRLGRNGSHFKIKAYQTLKLRKKQYIANFGSAAKPPVLISIVNCDDFNSLSQI